jgi:hypothetical protein
MKSQSLIFLEKELALCEIFLLLSMDVQFVHGNEGMHEKNSFRSPSISQVIHIIQFKKGRYS